ncbi:MAG: hypothetical protein J3K34DRAFT_429262 [Monoraphidium minutum]|nr:MAG: hypothetical protein J3K34DRAFT_429262 [Monoraphidium minutum]
MSGRWTSAEVAHEPAARAGLAAPPNGAATEAILMVSRPSRDTQVTPAAAAIASVPARASEGARHGKGVGRRAGRTHLIRPWRLGGGGVLRRLERAPPALRHLEVRTKNTQWGSLSRQAGAITAHSGGCWVCIRTTIAGRESLGSAGQLELMDACVVQLTRQGRCLRGTWGGGRSQPSPRGGGRPARFGSAARAHPSSWGHKHHSVERSSAMDGSTLE